MWRRLPVLLAAALLAAVPLTSPASTAPSAEAESTADSARYDWRNAQIGGGGFVPGIVFNRTEPGLVYARTDIGGAYRRDSGTAGRWVPLLDWVGQDNWGYNGVASLATDPVNPDRVYAAVGMYTNSWDPNNGAILRSKDRGESWEITELPFKLGGNMPGRGMGERLAIDPNDNSVLYLGTPSGNGLWRSTDHGKTWSEVGNFPNPGDYVADPSDTTGLYSDNQGVTWVVFDQSSGSSDSPTSDIYVGVADKQNTIYRSTDAGATWERVPNQPTGHLAHKAVLDSRNGYLYMATSNTGGPYDGSSGDVWKLDTETGAWTRISPVPSTSSDNYYGYSGLTIDRQNPDTLMVATQISWYPDVILFRSTDGGRSWSRIWDWDAYPNRELNYEMDISSVPWLTFGTEQPAPPETSPKLGWMTESVEIDPFDSDRMLYGTGATIYGTDNLTEWDAGDKIAIEPRVAGLEETAVFDLISPPGGAPVLSALGDLGGFRHERLDEIPDTIYENPVFTSTTSMDYAGTAPDTIVRVGEFDKSSRPDDSRVAFSHDGGKSWFQNTEPSGVTGGGTVAAAADGSGFVWSPEGTGVHHTTDQGASWQVSTGIPSGARVESDRVDPDKFYGFHQGTFYVSTDGGANFTASSASELPTGSGYFKAVPGRSGELWLTGEGGLWHSTDSGKSFSRISGVADSDNIGFGKSAPGSDYPAMYSIATIDGVTGVFRSDDAGRSWTRINDDQHQYGNIGDAITGDPDVYGRVYLGTNGRGVIYADPSNQNP
ncbi:hypothetical protein SAMN04487820_110135 [Actinopolyspora mzabensis]|uniref:Xyloglucanase n=1 Tax=Actinopolyspora mzabensis TaxID=995066 RepID=A0A1G9DJA6_ACTMZ|nr:xyloglucanase [Actinopolyspora mzabensis]SDK64003.1 hypothetical protein SAMN04487820_110135 [Actinopolyspora mzabensis]